MESLEEDLPSLVDIQQALRIPKSLACTLLLLLKQQIVTRQQIEEEHKTAANAKVAIHRLRQELRDAGYEIQSIRDGGYWLEPSDKSRLREEIRDRLSGA